MNLNQFTVELVWGFIIVFARIGSLFTTLPGISDSFFPSRIRLTFALIISLAILPILSEYIPTFPEKTFSISLIILREIFLGIFFGSVVRILIAATNIAGNILAIQSSFSSAMMFDPTQGTQSVILGNFYSIAAMCLMFVSDIHHIMLEGIIASFYFVKINNSFFSDINEFIISTMTQSFIIGIKIASPYLMVGLLLNITSSIIARVMPSVQIFFILTPLQILVCLIILYITFIASLSWFTEELAYSIKNFLD